MLEKLTDTQKLIGLLLVVLVLYILYMMYKTCKSQEHYANNSSSKHSGNLPNTAHAVEKVRIMNTPDNKANADSYHQPEQKPQNTYVNRNKCIVTSGSEFVGLPKELEEANGSEANSNYQQVNGIDGVDVGNTSALGLAYNKISRGPPCGSPQYPPPFKTTTKEDDDRMREEESTGVTYVPSGYTGYNGLSDAGNICITEQQRDFISGRGGNAACADYTTPFVKYDAAGCPA